MTFGAARDARARHARPGHRPHGGPGDSTGRPLLDEPDDAVRGASASSARPAPSRRSTRATARSSTSARRRRSPTPVSTNGTLYRYARLGRARGGALDRADGERDADRRQSRPGDGPAGGRRHDQRVDLRVDEPDEPVRPRSTSSARPARRPRTRPTARRCLQRHGHVVRRHRPDATARSTTTRVWVQRGSDALARRPASPRRRSRPPVDP